MQNYGFNFLKAKFDPEIHRLPSFFFTQSFSHSNVFVLLYITVGFQDCFYQLYV